MIFNLCSASVKTSSNNAVYPVTIHTKNPNFSDTIITIQIKDIEHEIKEINQDCTLKYESIPPDYVYPFFIHQLTSIFASNIILHILLIIAFSYSIKHKNHRGTAAELLVPLIIPSLLTIRVLWKLRHHSLHKLLYFLQEAGLNGHVMMKRTNTWYSTQLNRQIAHKYSLLMYIKMFFKQYILYQPQRAELDKKTESDKKIHLLKIEPVFNFEKNEELVLIHVNVRKKLEKNENVLIYKHIAYQNCQISADKKFHTVSPLIITYKKFLMSSVFIPVIIIVCISYFIQKKLKYEFLNNPKLHTHPRYQFYQKIQLKEFSLCITIILLSIFDCLPPFFYSLWYDLVNPHPKSLINLIKILKKSGYQEDQIFLSTNTHDASHYHKITSIT